MNDSGVLRFIERKGTIAYNSGSKFDCIDVDCAAAHYDICIFTSLLISQVLKNYSIIIVLSLLLLISLLLFYYYHFHLYCYTVSY